MKVIYFLISLIVTLAVIIFLSTASGKIPPLGDFLSPQHGVWQNADPTDDVYDQDIVLTGLVKPAEVYFDDRMVPHIFASDERDAYFIQGFLHARFRLWQMEFQIYAASGRLTEILGPGPDSAYLNNDRKMRRMGMVYGAKRSLAEMEKDPVTQSQINAYTAGVNSYLSQLTHSALPLEYRLLNYRPEKWTNLKTALLLKYLSYDLTGGDTDIEFTNMRTVISEGDFEKMFPLRSDSSDPVIPAGTLFPSPSVKPVAPPGMDSINSHIPHPLNSSTEKPERSNGSNNWVAGGGKTASGRPILCNDPHLGLNLPSLWYEVQITTPSYSVYGVSLPGAPAVIIGFNDSIAWGVTNAARDVLDYYEITFNGNDKSEYRFNHAWKKAELVTETYLMNDGSRFYDTVAYTVFGPVMFDDRYNGRSRAPSNKNLAIRWKAHDPSNEFKTFSSLNKAKNYREYEAALRHFSCPGQNFAFASKSGDIALWQQGQFPARWYRQGDFIMPGVDSAYMWQADIPQAENPHIKNPPRGFVSSANQVAADTAYPYYLGGSYDVYRGLLINRLLSDMQNITAADMQNLQNENYNVFAETAVPFLLAQIPEYQLDDQAKKYFRILSSWNRRNDRTERGATVFSVLFDTLAAMVWNDELAQVKGVTERPDHFTLIDALKKDSAFTFIDNVLTPQKETLPQLVAPAWKKAASSLATIEAGGKLRWTDFKDAGVRHLLRMEPLSRFHLPTGGGVHIINATKQFHGPSWKMVVHLTDTTEAYGIYPGGQSGNPGSKHYDEFIDDWAEGNYYRLWMMKKNETTDRRIKGHFSITPI